MGKEENVVGSKAESENEDNDEGQMYRSLFLSTVGIPGQFTYDTDIAEYCDTERKEEEDKHHA